MCLPVLHGNARRQTEERNALWQREVRMIFRGIPVDEGTDTPITKRGHTQYPYPIQYYIIKSRSTCTLDYSDRYICIYVRRWLLG